MDENPQDLTSVLGPEIAALINQGGQQGASAQQSNYVTPPHPSEMTGDVNSEAIKNFISSQNTQSPDQAPLGAGNTQNNQLLSSLLSGGIPQEAQQKPRIQGGLTPQQAAGPPRPTIGGLPGLVLDLIHPGRNVAPGELAPSKLQRFEGFLGNFLQSLSAGFSQEGTGPGSFIRGAGAAMQAPYQQALQQYGLQQQAQQHQAAIAEQQAKTRQTQIQTERMGNSTMITMPNGSQVMVPNDQLPSVLKSLATAQARVGAADIGADAKRDVQKPEDKVLNDARTALANGDVAGYQAKLKEATEMAAAKKPPVVKNNESEWISRIIDNPNDQASKDKLELLQKNREDIMKIRGASMGMGRLYGLQTVYHPDTGTTDYMTGFQVLNAERNGDNIIAGGRLSQDKIIAVQQLQSEAKPALQQVRGALKAFDNAGDRAIFARVMKYVGSPAAGDEHTWFGNLVNQVAKSNLSEDGKNLMIAEGRMAETLGRMRGVLGLQATDSAMALTLGLMAGVSTPDSKYAKKQTDTVEDMIKYAVQIPALTGKNPPSGGDNKGSNLNKDGFPIYKGK